MNYELTDGNTRAVLISPAEIGAAIGSSDLRLGQAIIARQPTPPCTAAALVELLDGGALADQPVDAYVAAFKLLCEELGRSLTPCDAALATDFGDPFDIPTDQTSVQLSVMTAKDAAEFLQAIGDDERPGLEQARRWCEHAVAYNLSIAMFTTMNTESRELVGSTTGRSQNERG